MPDPVKLDDPRAKQLEPFIEALVRKCREFGLPVIVQIGMDCDNAIQYHYLRDPRQLPADMLITGIVVRSDYKTAAALCNELIAHPGEITDSRVKTMPIRDANN